MDKSFKNIDKLIEFLEIDKDNQKKILKNSNFKLLLPYRLAKKIKKNDLSDPIFRQFVPIMEEENIDKNFSYDPLKEESFSKTNLLIHKYQYRALLITSNFCPLNCRFCFRKFLKKTSKNNNFESFDKEIEYIKKDSSIKEVILSGADPLSLSNLKLKEILSKLDEIEHLKIVRFHSRFLLADPSRINNDFLKTLKNFKKQKVFIFHFNHPNEIDEDIEKAIKLLKNEVSLIYSQSVLLKGINDNYKILKELFEKLIIIGITPYYLHQLDKVQGAKHFEVDEEKGKKLIKQLSESLPGYMIPKYVKDVPFEKNKITV
ncbi:MAG: KamA family radical SAM protein [Parachlamydiales bacterium]|nr:KamA family radical SAM protein [Parachlamydiales bacterium]